MKFSEFLKDPASYIWTYIDKKRGKEVVSLSPKKDEGDISNNNQQLKPKTDFLWIFKGKTGWFIKISIPFILVLYIASSVLNTPSPLPTNPPPVVDPGDILDTPDFVPNNYLSGVSFNETNLLYSKSMESINEIGVRGVIISAVKIEESADYYFPISLNDYIYFKDSSLILKYLQVDIIREYGQEKEIREEKQAVLVGGVSEFSDIKWLRLSYDGFVTFVYNNDFYVFTKRGELVDQYPIKEATTLYAYFDGEIFYVEGVVYNTSTPEGSTSTTTEYFLVGLNTNKEEIYRQSLGERTAEGSRKVHNIYVLNEDRFLIAFEQPSENSFFFIQLLDSQGRTLFGFSPKEEVQKITTIDHLYFSPNNNTILVVGGGISKLFTNTGKQLWIN